MDFWKSTTVRAMLGLIVGGILMLLKTFGVELDVDANKIVDGLTALGIIAFGVWQAIKRIQLKKSPTPINPATVPQPLAKMAGVR